MSPSVFGFTSGTTDDGADGWYGRDNDMNYADVDRIHGVRPVINLRSGVQITKGNGTLENPYIIKTN